MRFKAQGQRCIHSYHKDSMSDSLEKKPLYGILSRIVLPFLYETLIIQSHEYGHYGT